MSDTSNEEFRPMDPPIYYGWRGPSIRDYRKPSTPKGRGPRAQGQNDSEYPPIDPPIHWGDFTGPLIRDYRPREDSRPTPPPLLPSLPWFSPSPTAPPAPDPFGPRNGAPANRSEYPAPSSEPGRVAQNLTTQVLRMKGVPEADIGAAINDPALMGELLNRLYGNGR